MSKRFYQCSYPGCTVLIHKEHKGRCDKHKTSQFRKLLDRNRAPGSKEFYGSHKWKEARASYRMANPLCEECKKKGKIIKGDLVHHIIERPILESRGKDPYDPQYLQTLCNPCHLAELRKRKK